MNTLPEDEQDAIASQILDSLADAFRLFQANPANPGLQFKKLDGESDTYSVRVGLGYRALAVINQDRVVWYWIGSHAEYDRLV